MTLTKKIFICSGVCLLVGFLAGFATSSGIDSWYTTLSKPSFNPPNWIFAPVWTALYIMMGISIALVWQAATEGKDIGGSIRIFCAHLVLNGLWSIVFFGIMVPIYALAIIVILWLMISYMVIRFHRINPYASYLLIPYLMWVSFATALNYYIVVLN